MRKPFTHKYGKVTARQVDHLKQQAASNRGSQPHSGRKVVGGKSPASTSSRLVVLMREGPEWPWIEYEDLRGYVIGRGGHVVITKMKIIRE